MTLAKRWRSFYWFVRSIIERYTRALTLGFVGGLLATLLLGRIGPVLFSSYFEPVEHIGIVGIYTPSSIPLSIQQLLSVGLTTLDEKGIPKPGIASSWNVDKDGKEYIFHLKTIKWQNGKTLTSADINYNIQGITFVAQGPQTVKAELPDAYSPFPVLVAKPLLDVGLGGVGNYTVSKLRLKGEQLDRLSLKPVNDTHKPKKEYVFYRTEEAAFLGYSRGEVDRLTDIPDPGNFVSWAQTRIEKTVNYSQVVALYLNVKNGILGERAFRQALAYATPEFPDEKAADSPIPKTSWAYNDNVRQFTYNEDQAKKLLASVKLPSDFPGLTIVTFPQYEDYANKIAHAWSNAGIPTKVQIEQSLPHNFDVLLSAHDIPPDPDQYPLWHSQQTSTNITGYTNLKVDKLLEDGRKEFDPEVRKKLYTDFQKYLVEDVPVIFLFYPKTYTITRIPPALFGKF